MTRLFISCLFTVMVQATVIAQVKTTEETAVLQVVEQIFKGMRAADSAMVSDAFLQGAQLYTAFTNKEGKPTLHKGSLQTFLEAVGSPHNEVWNEPIWGTEIKIDGNLAQVWTKYAFYVGNTFSHCGVDAFHLFKTDEGWKVFHLTDTRERENCEMPEAIEKKWGKRK